MAVKREVIVHAHIFKNAGTTIDWVLERNFGKHFCDNREDQLMRTEKSYLNDFLENNKNISVISSHSLPLPLEPHRQFEFYPIVMLRHPLLRVRSVYDFERQQKGCTPGAINAKKKSFSEYVAWRMLPEVGHTIRNMQVRYLTFNSLPRVEQLDEDHLAAALKFINDNMLVGVVELFDQSMVVFDQKFNDLGFDIDFSYKKQNVSSSSGIKLGADQKIAALQDELGDDLYELLLSKNELDMRLHQTARTLLSTRFEQIKDSNFLLNDLRERCRAI